ncbi:MAG: type II toxin-antitoxin system RelE/ParE family toxin [Xenococcus sp. (in: cyanobacteria)]
MARYKITFKKSVARDLRSIPNQDVQRILAKFEELSDNPRDSGCIRLSGQARYRVRQGLYRIIYEIQDDILVVHVVKVGHRSSVYRDL